MAGAEEQQLDGSGGERPDAERRRGPEGRAPDLAGIMELVREFAESNPGTLVFRFMTTFRRWCGNYTTPPRLRRAAAAGGRAGWHLGRVRVRLAGDLEGIQHETIIIGGVAGGQCGGAVGRLDESRNRAAGEGAAHFVRELRAAVPPWQIIPERGAGCW